MGSSSTPQGGRQGQAGLRRRRASGRQGGTIYADAGGVHHLESQCDRVGRRGRECGHLPGRLAAEHDQQILSALFAAGVRCPEQSRKGPLHRIPSGQQLSARSRHRFRLAEECHASLGLEYEVRSGLCHRKYDVRGRTEGHQYDQTRAESPVLPRGLQGYVRCLEVRNVVRILFGQRRDAYRVDFVQGHGESAARHGFRFHFGG